MRYKSLNIVNYNAFISFVMAKAVFYIGGGCGILWCLCWMLLVSDDPTTHKFIKEEERRYILENRKQPMNNIGSKNPPYLKILLTPTVWVLMFTDFCISFGIYMILIEGPNFIANVLDKDILEVCKSYIKHYWLFYINGSLKI